MGESISTIQRPPRISTSHKFAAPRYRLPPMALQTVQVSVEPRLSTALKDRSVVPWSQSLLVSSTTFPTALSFYIAQGRLRKDIRPLSKLFSKAEPLPFEKEINITLVYSSCLKHANEMLLGEPRQADQRTQSFPFLIVIHQSLDPAARALKRQAPCLYMHMHSSTRQAQNASTRRVDAPSR